MDLQPGSSISISIHIYVIESCASLVKIPLALCNSKTKEEVKLSSGVALINRMQLMKQDYSISSHSIDNNENQRLPWLPMYVPLFLLMLIVLTVHSSVLFHLIVYTIPFPHRFFQSRRCVNFLCLIVLEHMNIVHIQWSIYCFAQAKTDFIMISNRHLANTKVQNAILCPELKYLEIQL